MESGGRATQMSSPYSFSSSGGAGAATQVSDNGYDGGSEGTLRQSADTGYDRQRPGSWVRHAQQPVFRNVSQPKKNGRRWRRKKLLAMQRRRARMCGNTNAPARSPLTTSTSSNHSPDANKHEPRQLVATPIPLAGLEEEKPQQQQHEQYTAAAAAAGTSEDEGSNETIATKVIDAGIRLTFQVQLAHGSPTGIISGFTSIAQLYQAIANCYDEITVDDILFCTVNTHRICMDALMGSNICINDFIFAHIAGQKKEVTLVKSEPALGLTVTDNGAGKTFIKRIDPGTVTSKTKPAIEVGDFIEKINGESMVGRRHFDVAKYLRTLPVGSTFTMRLIEPKRSGFNFIAAYSKQKRPLSTLNAKETIRFKADGTVVMQKLPNALVINKMNEIFDAYFGFHDDDLAQTIWDMIAPSKNLCELMNILKKSDLNHFNFPSEFCFDLWGAVDDYKGGRLSKIGDDQEKNATDAYLPTKKKL